MILTHGANSINRGEPILFLNYLENPSMVAEVKDESYQDTINLTGTTFTSGYYPDKNCIQLNGGDTNQTFYQSKAKEFTKNTIELHVIARGISPADLSATGINFGSMVIQFIGREINQSNFIRYIDSACDRNLPIIDNTQYVSALDNGNNIIGRGVTSVRPNDSGYREIQLIIKRDKSVQFIIDGTTYLTYYRTQIPSSFGLRLYKETYTYQSQWCKIEVLQY